MKNNNFKVKSDTTSNNKSIKNSKFMFGSTEENKNTQKPKTAKINSTTISNVKFHVNTVQQNQNYTNL